MKDVTCIVNGHNEGRVLFASLMSVARSLRYAEACGLKVGCHIVLDNVDVATLEIAEKFTQRSIDSGLSVEISKVEYGDLSSSRNFGINACESEFACFLDGDDLWCKTWIVACVQAARIFSGKHVFHPEYNVYFGGRADHVLHHVDMDDSDFHMNAFYRLNYWTALTFASVEIFKSYPYINNRIEDGFGYEDWTWNCQTISAGLKHKVVPGTAHFIRRAAEKESLLDKTNISKSIPRVLDIYKSCSVSSEINVAA